MLKDVTRCVLVRIRKRKHLDLGNNFVFNFKGGLTRNDLYDTT